MTMLTSMSAITAFTLWHHESMCSNHPATMPAQITSSVDTPDENHMVSVCAILLVVC